MVSKKLKDNKNSENYKILEIHGNTNYIRCDRCSLANKKIMLYDYSDFRKTLLK